MLGQGAGVQLRMCVNSIHFCGHLPIHDAADVFLLGICLHTFFAYYLTGCSGLPYLQAFFVVERGVSAF